MPPPANTSVANVASATERSLVLDLSMRGDLLVASLSPAGGALGPIQTTCERPFSIDRALVLHRRIVAVLGQANRWGDMDRGSRELLRKLGALLFDEVLPRRIKDALRAAGTGQLQLVIDQALVFVPWELMHHGTQFLGLAFGIGRIVRTPQSVSGLPRRPPEKRWRMLILCDPRGDLMGSYYEGVSLRDELDLSRRRLAVDLRASQVSIDDVRELIREYDVVHYAGHAKHDANSPEETGWCLTDGTLTAETIADLSGGHPFPRLVFANACRSGATDDKHITEERGAMVHGLADTMLLAGVQHYVGTLWDVPDEPACHFSLALYQALLAGSRLGEALRLARLSLVERYGDDSVLWASYVMYGTAEGRYFQSRRRPLAHPRQRPDSRPPRAGRDDAAVHPSAHSKTHTHRPTPRPHVTRVRGAVSSSPFSSTNITLPRWSDSLSKWIVAAIVTVLLILSIGAISSLAGPQAPPSPGWTTGVSLTATGPELHPAPLPSSGNKHGINAAPAAAVPQDGMLKPRVRLVVQKPSAPLGAPNAAIAPSIGAVLNSWDHFQVHMRLNRPAYAAVWHIESNGALRRVFPEADEQAVSEVPSVAWTELPGRDAWYFLDDARGKEMFILAVNDHGDLDEDELVDALRPLQERLLRLRSSNSPTKAGGLKDRVITDDRTVLKAIVATFHDFFDAASTVEFEHR